MLKWGIALKVASRAGGRVQKACSRDCTLVRLPVLCGFRMRLRSRLFLARAAGLARYNVRRQSCGPDADTCEPASEMTRRARGAVIYDTGRAREDQKDVAHLVSLYDPQMHLCLHIAHRFILWGAAIISSSCGMITFSAIAVI